MRKKTAARRSFLRGAADVSCAVWLDSTARLAFSRTM